MGSNEPMNLLRKIGTILEWAALGVISSYIIISLILTTQLFIIVLVTGSPFIDSWVTQGLLYGMGAGFLLGMLKAFARDVVYLLIKK